MSPSDNSKGREANAAQPLGVRSGTDFKAKAERIGRQERKSAGPDGPDARVVGDTFKRR